MNGEHLSAKQFDRYSRKVMTAAELLAADAHLAGCRRCREAAAEWPGEKAGADSFFTGLSGAEGTEPAHLVYQQLAGLVDGTLDAVDREIVESHLAVCEECKADWLDLERFGKLLAAPTHSPAAVNALTGVRRITAALLGPQASWAPLRVAAALAGIALLIWVGSIPLRRDIGISSQKWAQSGAQAPQRAGEKDLSGTIAGPAVAEIVALNDAGGRVVLRGDGSLAGLAAASPKQRDAALRVLAGRPLALPDDLAEISAPAGTLLGTDRAGTRFELTGPIGTAVIPDRPMLRWQPLAGARLYEVSIYDESYSLESVSPRIEGTKWAPTRPLAGGRVYSWQVKAFKDREEVLSPKPPAPEAKFKVLDRKYARELERMRREQPNSHLLLALAYAQAGALDDAEWELKALAEANPQSPVPGRLLGEISAARRR